MGTRPKGTKILVFFRKSARRAPKNQAFLGFGSEVRDNIFVTNDPFEIPSTILISCERETFISEVSY